MLIDPAIISIVLPGIAPLQNHTRPSKPKGVPIKLLCVGSIIPRKGQRYLIEALSGLQNYSWHLDLIGENRLDPIYSAHLQSLIEKHRLQDRIHLHGSIPQKPSRDFMSTQISLSYLHFMKDTAWPLQKR